MGGIFSSFADKHQEPSTPLSNSTKHAGFTVKDQSFDPRSPSEGISRTPIQYPGPVRRIHDPRSPSDGINRTPIIKQNVITVKKHTDYSNKRGYRMDGGEVERSYNGELGYEDNEAFIESIYNDGDEEEGNEDDEEEVLNGDDEVDEGDEAFVKNSCGDDYLNEEEEVLNEDDNELNDDNEEAEDYEGEVGAEDDFERTSGRSAHDSLPAGECKKKLGEENASLEARVEMMSLKLRELEDIVEIAYEINDLSTWSNQSSSSESLQRSVRSRSASPARQAGQPSRSKRSSSEDACRLLVEASGGSSWFYASEAYDDSCLDLLNPDRHSKPEPTKKPMKLHMTSTPTSPVHCYSSKGAVKEAPSRQKNTPVSKKERKVALTTNQPPKDKKDMMSLFTQKNYTSSHVTTPKMPSRKPLAHRNTPVVVQPKLLIRNKQIRNLQENLTYNDKEN